MIKPNAPRIHAPVCGVFAVYLADKKRDFDGVFNLSKEVLGRRSNWKGRMYWNEVLSLLRTVGVKVSEVPEIFYEGATLENLAKSGVVSDGRQYVLFVSGHFLTFKDGLCYDQSNPEGKPVAEYRRRRSTVKQLAVIV